jgi:hypothetical protein
MTVAQAKGVAAQESTVPDGAACARNKKVQAWRHRVLLKKASGLHERMGDSTNHSLAVLDEFGFVIVWYDRGRSTRSDDVLDRHVSQFYLSRDITSDAPTRHLKSALLNGSSIRRGWRLHHDGVAFWGTTTITPILLGDGRLQGFSHLTHVASAAPTDCIIVSRDRSSSADDDDTEKSLQRNRRVRGLESFAYRMTAPLMQASA